MKHHVPFSVILGLTYAIEDCEETCAKLTVSAVYVEVNPGLPDGDIDRSEKIVQNLQYRRIRR